jgi:hypothetical protein
MARYGSAIESQTAMLAGMPATTTVNGYIGYLGAGASAGYRLRRLTLGVRAGASVPTSQQMTIRVHRQTVAPAGTGLAAAVVGEKYELWTPTDPTAGLIATTATTIGTTGPTLNTAPLKEFSFNTQSGWDVPIELLEEMICNSGTANGLAFVNIGNALPASHLFTIECEWEV